METLITILLPLLIGYILGKDRDNNKTLFNKKLEIYSDIVYYISAAKYLKSDINNSLKKLTSLSQERNKLQAKEAIDTGLYSFDDSEELTKKINLINNEDDLLKLFAPARLIGSSAVVDELREYYSLITEYRSIKEKKDVEDLVKKISKSVMELEQLMRKDLGRFRLLSKWDIWWHVHKSI